MKPLACLLLAALAACSGTDDSSHFSRHFDSKFWVAGLAAQPESTSQITLEAGLLAATLALFPFDDQIVKEETEDTPITEGSVTNGDATAVGLTLLATGLGVGEWIGGDHAHGLEVLGESFLITEGMTELLKHTVNRERPSKDSNTSFPSGHTSYAFVMATFLQRRISDLDDGLVGKLAYLAYLPAAYVGIDRVEANRHWPSDVAFGAFLGVFLTNVVYDAHYGAAGRPSLFGVSGLGMEIQPLPDGVALAFGMDF